MSRRFTEAEIDRRPDEVFARVTDPSRFSEWQAEVVSARAEGSGPLQEGSRMVMTRRMGGREQTMTSEYMNECRCFHPKILSLYELQNNDFINLVI